MTMARRLGKPGVVAGAAVAALALLTTPQASAATSAETVRLTGPTDFTANSDPLASCSNDLSGPVTSHDDSTGESVANIDNVTFDCSDGTTSITANALPWTLHLFGNDAFTLDGFDVNVTTPQGTCRYTGDVEGAFQFPDGIDDIRISMTRQTAGCGWPKQVSGFGFPETVTRSSATE
jgi:hypothetical protein